MAKLSEELEKYLFETYDTREHPALGVSPREMFLQGLQNTGYRTHRMIPYDDKFLLATAPSTPKGTVKVSPSHGVKVRNICYWCDAFRHPDVQYRSVPVKYDPFDVGHIYAFVKGVWTECRSEYYATFKGRSEKELALLTAEVHRRRRRDGKTRAASAREAAALAIESQSEERILLQQQKDRESSLLRSNGQTPYSPLDQAHASELKQKQKCSGNPMTRARRTASYGRFNLHDVKSCE